jgi:uncharacterized protein YybS (DUF2232 family)
VPVIGIITNLVLPLPFILFAAKYKLKYSGALFAAAIFLSFLAGSIMGLVLLFIYGTVGFVMGYMIQRNKSRAAILISSTLTFMFFALIMYVISAAFFHMDMFHEILSVVKQSNIQSQELLKSRIPDDQLKMMVKQNNEAIKLLEVLAPTILLFSSIFSVLIIQLVCLPIAKRFGLTVPTWGKFRNLTLPKSLLWYYLLALAANFLLHPKEGTYLFAALINLTYVLEFFMIIQGFSFLYFFFHQRNFPKGLRLVITVLALLPIFRYIIRILGIIDLGMDLRKRFDKKE